MEVILEFSHKLVATISSESTIFSTGLGHYILFAIVVAVEGPITTLFGAAAASAGIMHPGWVFFAASCGNMTADILWYSLGYMGKTEWALHYAGWLGLRRYHIDRLEKHIHDHAAKVLLLAKLSAGFMIPTLIAAGLAKVPMRRWLPALLLGETLWTGMLVITGFYATEAIKQVEKGIHYVGIGGSILFVLVIFFWIMRRYVRKSEDFRDVEMNNDNGNNENPPAVR